ncbi:triose-phosphate isomerase [Candidatus Campbellbacteria bacterium CG22_combo_CG10-13_8_21_14_all_36_13]|uniref:Triosephosphate isomerase n=1 Tax=Candidatus Campbellbacteria bacterium CG22_combo_CG10-13_8_21_14_all_36_13 TaxID=1974529 RepID=A0A2H0E0D6_9BACT|nr:MAG: triose-phosphate isomerase [Candidatus Campbellbacteria bacterium CG22_combo_CG10-13_8_21_14_all_36_13]
MLEYRYMNSKTKYVIGNWKMEPRTAVEARALFLSIKKQSSRIKNTSIIICPPAIFLGDLQMAHSGNKISIGAQNVFWENPSSGRGAFTGEISANQLIDSSVEYVIVGHSERRALGETNEIVAEKLHTIVEAKLTPILCIGERLRDEEGEYLSFIKEQIETALRDVPHNKIKNIIIAYEPVWAIGRGDDAMGPKDMHEVSLYIHKILVSMFGKKIASGVDVVYGGSVERSNAEELIKGGEISGFLVGHASLYADHFIDIVKIVDNS